MTIYLDMDGTVYDLYNMPNWLKRVENEDVTVFEDNVAIFDSEADYFLEIVSEMMYQYGVKFEVITWTPMFATPDFCQKVAEAKEQWCKKKLPFLSGFAAIPYGTIKQNAITKRDDFEILIDDNLEVCQRWQDKKSREAWRIFPNHNIVKVLEQLLSILKNGGYTID